MITYISKLLTSINYLLKSRFQGFWSTIPFAKLQLFPNFSRKHPLNKAGIPVSTPPWPEEML